MKLMKVSQPVDTESWHEYFLWFPSLVHVSGIGREANYEIRWLETVMRKLTFTHYGDGMFDTLEEYESMQFYESR